LDQRVNGPSLLIVLYQTRKLFERNKHETVGTVSVVGQLSAHGSCRDDLPLRRYSQDS
jgi:hypothetical protein